MNKHRAVNRCARWIISTGTPLNDMTKEIRVETIKRVLRRKKGNKSQAAKELGMGRVTLIAEIRRYQEQGLLTTAEIEGE